MTEKELKENLKRNRKRNRKEYWLNVLHYGSDFGTAMEIRVTSLQALIANLREPKFIRGCLWEDNKRLLKQAITGKRI